MAARGVGHAKVRVVERRDERVDAALAVAAAEPEHRSLPDARAGMMEVALEGGASRLRARETTDRTAPEHRRQRADPSRAQPCASAVKVLRRDIR